MSSGRRRHGARPPGRSSGSATSTATAHRPAVARHQRQYRDLVHERHAGRLDRGRRQHTAPPGRSSAPATSTATAWATFSGATRSGNLAVWLMNGAPVASSAGLGNVPASVDGRRHRRLQRRRQGRHSVARHQRQHRDLVHERRRRSSVDRWRSATFRPYWSVVGTGDFNGDGKSDIVWRDTSRQHRDLADERRGGFVGRRPRQRADHMVDRRRPATTTATA